MLFGFDGVREASALMGRCEPKLTVVVPCAVAAVAVCHAGEEIPIMSLD